MKKIIICFAVIAILAFVNANAEQAPADIPAGDYSLDKSHSSIVFSVSHVGFSQYTMQFLQFDAKLKLDPAHAEKSQIEVTIDPRSLLLPDPPAGFHDELLGAEWLDTTTNPQIIFRSTKIEPFDGNGNKARITGDLTLHGITKPIVLEAVFNGGYKGMPDLDPHARAGFSATTKFKRSDFGIEYGLPAPGTTMGVGDEVTVKIETEFSGPALK